MEYGALIRRAWRITWQYRFLWVLGLFATSTVGSCSAYGSTFQFRLDSSDVERFFSPDLARAFQEADPLLSRNVGWLLLGLALLALLALVAFAIASLVAQGGMADATGHLGQEHAITVGDAWGRGRQLFWRYLLLWVLLLGLTLLVAAAIAVVIGVAVAIGTATRGAPRTFLIVLGGALTVVGVVVAIPLLVAVSVVVAYAQRAIAIEGEGPWQSLQTGTRLVWGSLGTSALAWLISLALSVAAGIVILLAAGVLLLPLGALGAAIFSATGSVVSIPLVVYAVFAVLVLLAGTWFVAGVANAFFWNYWTLIYLRLTGRLAERLEPPA